MSDNNESGYHFGFPTQPEQFSSRAAAKENSDFFSSDTARNVRTTEIYSLKLIEFFVIFTVEPVGG